MSRSTQGCASCTEIECAKCRRKRYAERSIRAQSKLLEALRGPYERVEHMSGERFEEWVKELLTRS